ncbi:transglycosylase SLT domain-containing protein [Pseudoxanthomonas indica]|uniref:Soluble lytic murein transglycosylase n=1 Tax=Pseudoxanthomonas indica TaxID=428993 RepID=A0A1T5KV75_9GAMM|nr:transglycosylase SLT domain-containing protein [Pseudoxanthomonas indica]GGD52137.1 murein transglycosylase [Pseudoxanthomonas indica]SKC67694.1 soluble lytic murein transglycosylase [Pseudoxanthomonas indica]
MSPRLSLIVLAATLALLAAPAVQAQNNTGNAAPPGAGNAGATQASLANVRAALEAAERGQFNTAQFPGLSTHPLYGWIELASLRRDIDAVSTAQAQAFLKRYEGQAVADNFRAVWLASLSRRQDWPTFLSAYTGSENTTLRCAELNARQATGRADAQWTRDAQALWRGADKSLPDVCDPVFAVLANRGGLPPALRWERIDAAAAAGQAAVMRSAARGLPADETALAADYAAFIDAPHARALNWPRTDRSRRMASYGLARLAGKNPSAAETELAQYTSALGLTDADRGRVLYQIALWSVASYEPDSARRLNEVPEGAYDERLHEWRVREAMARGDWRNALVALRRMPAKQRGDDRWKYFEARLSEKTGDQAAAQRLFAEVARSPTFHGFLAADRLNQPYALCPWISNDSDADKARIARDPAIVRAMLLWQLDRPGWATAEWNSALSRFDDVQRRLAVEVAQDNGWFDRAVFSLGKNPEEQRLYQLRFPLHHGETIKREAAKNAIDPAWVAAEIRAESVFNPRARSAANAMGLMQVVPATGAATAKKIGLPWTGAASLYDSDTNIQIGTAYLREMENKYGMPYIAIAAYNAGPTPTARWQSQRPGFDPDIWIETISYKETRDYVARVLAFSVIYDWRLNGNALPITDRMLGKLDGKRRSFVCPEARLPRS